METQVKNPTDSQYLIGRELVEQLDNCQRFHIECGSLRIEVSREQINKTINKVAFRGAKVRLITYMSGTKGIWIEGFL